MRHGMPSRFVWVMRGSRQPAVKQMSCRWAHLQPAGQPRCRRHLVEGCPLPPPPHQARKSAAGRPARPGPGAPAAEAAAPAAASPGLQVGKQRWGGWAGGRPTTNGVQCQLQAKLHTRTPHASPTYPPPRSPALTCPRLRAHALRHHLHHGRLGPPSAVQRGVVAQHTPQVGPAGGCSTRRCDCCGRGVAAAGAAPSALPRLEAVPHLQVPHRQGDAGAGGAAGIIGTAATAAAAAAIAGGAILVKAVQLQTQTLQPSLHLGAERHELLLLAGLPSPSHLCRALASRGTARRPGLPYAPLLLLAAAAGHVLGEQHGGEGVCRM